MHQVMTSTTSSRSENMASQDLMLDQVEADIRLCEEFLARDNFAGAENEGGSCMRLCQGPYQERPSMYEDVGVRVEMLLCFQKNKQTEAC